MIDRVREKEILVIGFGNEFRNDDRIGLLAANMIAEKKIPGVKCVEGSGEALGQMQLWSEFRTLYLIDAVCSECNAGTIHRIDPQREPLSVGIFNRSTHAFSVAECVELAKVMGTLPDQCYLFGIEGNDFGWGRTITPAVQRAAERVADIIISEIGLMFNIDPAIQAASSAMTRQLPSGELPV